MSKHNKHNLDKNIVLRLPEPMLNDFKDVCFKNYKTVSESIRDLIQRYIKEDKKNG